MEMESDAERRMGRRKNLGRGGAKVEGGGACSAG